MKKDNSKENGKRMSQEEFDKDMDATREEIDLLTMMLEESQRIGWVLRKKLVKWHKLQRRLRQKQVKLLTEKLREAELEMEVSICEPEQGKEEDFKTETSSDTKGSHDFK